MTPRRILITNNTLANRAGSEMYVRDLTRALRERGHQPVAFSTVLGEVAEELRLLTIPVVDDLSNVPAPDLIHGQHHLETMTALAHFPATPAVFVCHGWLPWEETPPLHPRILRYIAVDTTVRDRLTVEHGIPAERVELILNFVDLERFKPRGSLPSRLSRALVFSNEIAEGSILESIRTACASRKIQLDVRGAAIGESLSAPEALLPLYDLVFARGRSAIEALAAGTAVILTAPDSFGPMIDLANLDEVRQRNFGIRAIQIPASVEGILREIDRYDAAQAEAVSIRMRQVAGMKDAVEAIEENYEKTIAEFRNIPDERDERLAFAGYLQFLARSTKGRVLGLNHVPALLSRTRLLEATIAELQAELLRNGQHLTESTRKESALTGELESSKAEKANLTARLSQMTKERARLADEVQRLTRELMDAREENTALTAGRERLEASVDELQQTVSNLADALASAAGEKKKWDRSLTVRGVRFVRRMLWK